MNIILKAQLQFKVLDFDILTRNRFWISAYCEQKWLYVFPCSNRKWLDVRI